MQLIMSRHLHNFVIQEFHEENANWNILLIIYTVKEQWNSLPWIS